MIGDKNERNNFFNVLGDDDNIGSVSPVHIKRFKQNARCRE